jgi:hypothetical protein
MEVFFAVALGAALASLLDLLVWTIVIASSLIAFLLSNNFRKAILIIFLICIFMNVAYAISSLDWYYDVGMSNDKILLLHAVKSVMCTILAIWFHSIIYRLSCKKT